MATTAAEIIALEAAIKSGVVDVSYGDKRVTYRSLAEMKEILAAAKLDLIGAPRIRQVRFTTASDKGL